MSKKRQREPATIASDGHDCPDAPVQPAVAMLAGDWAIIGDRKWSRPDEWFLAQIIWVDDDSVVTEHNSAAGGHRYRSLFPVERVLGVGEYLALDRHRRNCAEAVRHLQERASAAEEALRQARQAFSDELDRIGMLKLARWPDSTGEEI